MIGDFDWQVIARNLPFVMEGMGLSLLLVLVATVGGAALGTGLALVRLYAPAPPLRALAAGYVAVMRSLPLILVLFWFYFLVPLAIGRPVGALASALVAFVLFEAAFYGEIVRAGILGVRPGQAQAALATGLRRRQALRLVVLPQALRAMVPVFLNQVVLVFQDTSLVYVVSLRDFLTASSLVANRDGRPLEMFTFVTAVYLAICLPAGLLLRARQGRRGPARVRPA